MYHVVIDLEMCRVPRRSSADYRCRMETIQIGAVLLDENFVRIGTLSEYVNPSYGAIDSFIGNLTGIRQSDLRGAPKLKEALVHLVDWIGDREYRIYAWSRSDRQQLLHELRGKGIVNEKIAGFMQAARWVDYQAVFVRRYKLGREYSLEEALIRADIRPEGRFHDGLDDAVNTGKLIQKLELDPGFELTAGYVPPVSDAPLSCSFGDLLAKMQIKVG